VTKLLDFIACQAWALQY